MSFPERCREAHELIESMHDADGRLLTSPDYFCPRCAAPVVRFMSVCGDCVAAPAGDTKEVGNSPDPARGPGQSPGTTRTFELQLRAELFALVSRELDGLVRGLVTSRINDIATMILTDDGRKFVRWVAARLESEA